MEPRLLRPLRTLPTPRPTPRPRVTAGPGGCAHLCLSVPHPCLALGPKALTQTRSWGVAEKLRAGDSGRTPDLTARVGTLTQASVPASVQGRSQIPPAGLSAVGRRRVRLDLRLGAELRAGAQGSSPFPPTPDRAPPITPTTRKPRGAQAGSRSPCNAPTAGAAPDARVPLLPLHVLATATGSTRNMKFFSNCAFSFKKNPSDLAQEARGKCIYGKGF